MFVRQILPVSDFDERIQPFKGDSEWDLNSFVRREFRGRVAYDYVHSLIVCFALVFELH